MSKFSIEPGFSYDAREIKEIPEKTKPMIVSDSQQEKENNFCLNCRKHIDGESNFCPDCYDQWVSNELPDWFYPEKNQ